MAKLMRLKKKEKQETKAKKEKKKKTKKNEKALDAMGHLKAQGTMDQLKRLAKQGRPFPLSAYKALAGHAAKRVFAQKLELDSSASFLAAEEALERKKLVEKAAGLEVQVAKLQEALAQTRGDVEVLDAEIGRVRKQREERLQRERQREKSRSRGPLRPVPNSRTPCARPPRRWTGPQRKKR